MQCVSTQSHHIFISTATFTYHSNINNKFNRKMWKHSDRNMTTLEHIVRHLFNKQTGRQISSISHAYAAKPTSTATQTSMFGVQLYEGECPYRDRGIMGWNVCRTSEGDFQRKCLGQKSTHLIVTIQRQFVTSYSISTASWAQNNNQIIRSNARALGTVADWLTRWQYA